VVETPGTSQTASSKPKPNYTPSTDAGDLPAIPIKTAGTPGPSVPEIEAALDKTKEEYNAGFAKFLSSQPTLSQWHALAEDYSKQFSTEADSPMSRELLAWMQVSSFSNPETKAKADERRKEVGRVRQFLFLEQLDTLLQDPNAAGFVTPWLNARIQTLGSTPDGYARRADASNWAALGDSLFPDQATARAFLTAPNRQELIQRYSAQKGLGTVDASMPEGAEDHLRAMMKLMILQDAADGSVLERMPNSLKQLRAQTENLQAQLAHLKRPNR